MVKNKPLGKGKLKKKTFGKRTKGPHLWKRAISTKKTWQRERGLRQTRVN